jgi:hypothetical protein
MTTCLDDLNATLIAIRAALDGAGGTVAPSISVSSQSRSSASSAATATAFAASSANAMAYAQAAAIASVVLAVDVRVETTNIVRLRLPPLSINNAPDEILYPPAETGITDTPATTTTGGELCQLLHYYIALEATMLGYLRQSPLMAQVIVISSVLTVAQIETVVKLLLTLAAAENLPGLILDASVIVGMVSTLFEAQQAGIDPLSLLESVEEILLNENVDIVCILYEALAGGSNGLDAIAELFGWIDTNLEPTYAERAMLAWMINPTVLNAALYLPLVGSVPATTHDCSCFQGE